MKKNESGRSMVEMLGVLAIIGVLSIGGIAGYTLSMRRYRANAIVDSVNKYALINYSAAQAAKLNGNESTVIAYADAGLDSPDGLDQTNTKVTAITVNTGNDSVTLDISVTDKKVCQAIASIVGASSTQNTCEASSKITGFAIKQN